MNNETSLNNLNIITKYLSTNNIEYRANTVSHQITVKECPFCLSGTEKADNQYKLSINYDKMVYHCFRCESSGSWGKFKKDLNGEIVEVEKRKYDGHIKLWELGQNLNNAAAAVGREYFKLRGLSTPVTDEIRYSEKVEYWEDKVKVGEFHALLIRICNNEGDHVATQVIYLDSEGRKAAVSSSKKCFGSVKGGSVKLGSTSDEIGVAEGIETTLALHEAFNNQLTVYSTVSAFGMANFELPAGVKRLHVFSDLDKSGTGERAAFKLANKLHERGVEVYLHMPRGELAGGQKSKDFLDVFNSEKSQILDCLIEPVRYSPEEHDWILPMREEAYYGITGAFVRQIEPYTEADPNALLLQFLLFIGSLIGRKPAIYMSSDRHGTNLYGVIAGETSRGRKGTGLGNVRMIFEKKFPFFFKNNFKSGLASGEGLIHALRDPREEGVEESAKPSKDKQAPSSNEKKTKVVDRGVTDKRLLLTETEFAQILMVAARPGNIISTMLRNAWDGKTLQNMSKGSPEIASNPHVSIVGHITPSELSKTLNETDQSNGLANRFLWCLSRMSKELPLPYDLRKIDFDNIGRHLEYCILKAAEVESFELADEAKELWAKIYKEMLRVPKGLLGNVTSRSYVHILRLSIIYAILDGETQIKSVHLHAARAVWDYCYDSAAFLFGGQTTNVMSRRILDALKRSHDGLTRTQIRSLFGGHKSTDQIDFALSLLKKDHFADFTDEPTGGRSAERWFAI